jgi:thiol-disulfide isomerase/thioredoxin
MKKELKVLLLVCFVLIALSVSILFNTNFHIVTAASGGKTVLYDFYSDSCGPCRAMNPAVQALINAGYAVERINVNVNSNKNLVAQYGIGPIPAFIMVVNGQEVDRVVGGTSYSRLEGMVKLGQQQVQPVQQPPQPPVSTPITPSPTTPPPTNPNDGWQTPTPPIDSGTPLIPPTQPLPKLNPDETKICQDNGGCGTLERVCTDDPSQKQTIDCGDCKKQDPCVKLTNANNKCGEDAAKACDSYKTKAQSCGSNPTFSYKTDNFIVTTGGGNACAMAYTAEYYRCFESITSTGKKFPNWEKPATVNIEFGPNLGAGGKTNFVFDKGEVFNWDMNIQGSPERVADSVLPHEIQHTVTASYLRKPVPRWADEGISTTTEHYSELNRHRQMLDQFLRTGRGIAFNQMINMMDYPKDIMPIYAQGYSTTDYLLQLGGGDCVGKKKFFDFLKQGTTSGDWNSALQSNYGISDTSQFQNSWLDWLKSGSPVCIKKS